MKNIQKQYERKIKVSQHNDLFTTYQRHSHSQYSPNPKGLKQKQQSFQQSQHQHIESLKSTLKSINQVVSMELTKPYQKSRDMSYSEKQLNDLQSQKYNLKLNELSKNLQEIASKCYFSPANSTVVRNNLHPNSQNIYPIKTNPQISTNIKPSKLKYEPLQTELFSKQSNSMTISNYPSKSHSFVRKDQSKDISKSNSQTKIIPAEQKIKQHQNLLWSGKNQMKSHTKSFSKKQVVTESLISNKKNLTKIFQNFTNTTIETTRVRERSESQMRGNTTIFSQNIHRSKISSILIADHIYTASLDYTIKRIFQVDGEFQSQFVCRFRGGVNHIASINNKIYGCGRDCYLRSVDGNFFHKFTSAPVNFCESSRSNLASIGFASNLTLFDLERRKQVSQIPIEKGYQMITTFNKELYIGKSSKLSILDWRNKNQIVDLFSDPDKAQCRWLSDSLNNRFCYLRKGLLTELNQSFKKVRSVALQPNFDFRSYNWGKNGLNIMGIMQGMQTCKVWRYNSMLEAQQMDVQAQGDCYIHLITREKQFIYGGLNGEILIKQIRQ